MRCMQAIYRFMPTCLCMVLSRITRPAGAVVRAVRGMHAELRQHRLIILSFCDTDGGFA
eukprot:COSAG03_NODE_2_length_28887_cov_60.449825_21_plen_59_part_00